MAGIHGGIEIAPEHQVPQWLFAFDPAGMATFRALALLAIHPDYARVVRSEVEAQDDPTRMPTLRATVLESLRLWPTSPLILRETSTETTWENGTLPAHSAVTIFSPFFHRDDQRLPQANSFSPDLWAGDRPTTDWPFIPFSEGSAGASRARTCPLANHRYAGRSSEKCAFPFEARLPSSAPAGRCRPR